MYPMRPLWSSMTLSVWLSRLHQLRGRVGRGSDQSYCILIADPKSEEGKERMRIMTETSDGFVLSEKDLELRGPGDFSETNKAGFLISKLPISFMITGCLKWRETMLPSS